MKYQDYRYLYPPRPKTAVAPTTLDNYEGKDWWAQAKFNGTCTTIYVPPTRDSFAMGRHGPDNKLVWQPGERWNHFQQRLPGEGWYVFVGELLHSKGIGVRDTMYLFDLLVDNGEYLIGETLYERLMRIQTICNNVESPGKAIFAGTHTIVSPGVWVTCLRISYFRDWFNRLQTKPEKPPIEGLVLKNIRAKLLPCGRAGANEKWQFKCRLATNNLSF